jgi:hypothetical protein
LIDIEASISVPAVRESITRRANPSAASQAPKVRRRRLIRPIFIDVHTKSMGIINTSLSVMPSSISKDINRCVRCIINATSIISGIRCINDRIEVIDSRSEPVFDLQGRCFYISFRISDNTG